MDAACGPVIHASVYDGIKWTAYLDPVMGNNDSNSTPSNNVVLVDTSDEEKSGRGSEVLLGLFPIRFVG